MVRLAFSRPTSEQFDVTRTVVSFTAAQLIASLVSRYFILTDLRIVPGEPLNPLVLIAATREDVTVALLAAAATAAFLLVLRKRWQFVPLGALAIFAYAHCALLGVNALAVHWLGTPLTLQWLYFADLMQSHTPRSAVAAVATPGSVAIVAVIALAPLLTHLIFRRASDDRRSRARLSWFAATMFVGATLFAASAAVRPLGGADFKSFRESPVHALAASLFTATPRFLEQAPRATGTEFVAVPPAVHSASETDTPNIVLIVLESVGAKAVEAERGNLPVLDRLMTEGRYFPNTYAGTASSPRSLFSLVASRNPVLGLRSEIQWVDDRDFAALPDVLHRYGYETAFIGVDLDYARARPFIQSGYDHLHDVLEEGCSRKRRPHSVGQVADDCLFAVAAERAARATEPFFLTIWTNDTHAPYTSNGSGLVPMSHEAYRQGLITTDRAIGKFLERLEAGNLLESSIVILVGDHGEAFGEHGRRVHSTTIFEEEVRVPLIVWKDGSRLSGSDARLARLIDVAPTILHLAGKQGEASWSGVSVLSGLAPKRAFFFSSYRGVQIGFRERASKVVLDYGRGNFSRYDLEEDPNERLPVELSEKEREEAEAIIAGWVQRERDRYRQ